MTKIRVEKLIMKIAKGCKTGCNLCLEGQKKDVEFFNSEEIENLIHALQEARKIIDFTNIKIFTFYGSTVMRHPKIFDMMNIVGDMIPGVTFCMDIGDVVPYDQEYMDFLLESKNRYPIIYVFVRNIDDMMLLKQRNDWILFFSFLTKNPNFLSHNPSIRYGKNDYLSLKILSKIFEVLPSGGVSPSYAKHPYVDTDAKKFHSEKLGTQTCKYFTYLEKNPHDGNLNFSHDENEINLMLDGSLTIHTNICYLSKYRYITNVFHTEKQIDEELSQFYENLKMVNSGGVSLEEACYRCIYGIKKE